MKPLERAQLRNWRDYLDFEMANGSHERTIVLFERCVIACALYEEFWIKVGPSWTAGGWPWCGQSLPLDWAVWRWSPGGPCKARQCPLREGPPCRVVAQNL